MFIVNYDFITATLDREYDSCTKRRYNVAIPLLKIESSAVNHVKKYRYVY